MSTRWEENPEAMDNEFLEHALKLLQVRDWVQYWDEEEELADTIFEHLRQAYYLLSVARANIEADDPSPPASEDI